MIESITQGDLEIYAMIGILTIAFIGSVILGLSINFIYTILLEINEDRKINKEILEIEDLYTKQRITYNDRNINNIENDIMTIYETLEEIKNATIK